MVSAKLVAEYLEYKDGHLWWVKRPPGPTKNIIGNRFGSVGKLKLIKSAAVNYTKNLQRKSYD